MRFTEAILLISRRIASVQGGGYWVSKAQEFAIGALVGLGESWLDFKMNWFVLKNKFTKKGITR